MIGKKNLMNKSLRMLLIDFNIKEIVGMENLTFKESYTEGNIIKDLNKEDKKKWKNFNIVTKKRLIHLFKTDKETFKKELEFSLSDSSSTNLNPDKVLSDNEKEKLINFFATQGIYYPSQTTLNAFSKQNIMANFDKFYHAFGTFTLNMENQATYNYYQTQQNQNFIQIAQNDTIIKQQEKIVEQNDEIIKLLKIISEK